MTIKKLYIRLTRTVLTALLLIVALTGCERKELWLRPVPTVDIGILDIRLDLIWGADWRALWQYDWDENLYGPIGYTTPDYMRASIYRLDVERKRREAPFTKNFPSYGGRVSLEPGHWYDMLFFSAGTDYILFNQSDTYDYYNATTRASDLLPVISRGATEESNGQEQPKTYESYKQPDEFFGTFFEDLDVPSDPEAYEYVYDATSGKMIYLKRIEAEMIPYSFIYLVQVMVVNNTDSVGNIISYERRDALGNVVRHGASGMTITGLSKGTDLFTRGTARDACSVTVDESDIRVVQHKPNLRLPNGDVMEGDIFASRILTWGLPCINPYDEWDAVQAGTSTTNYADRNKLGVRFLLRNGFAHTEVFDISDQMRAHPCGGVITVVMDAKENITSDELNQDPSSKGGGFNANVENWENEMNAEITI